METTQGKLIIFSAPSGAGKTTIVRYLLQRFPDLEFSVSATTRTPRPEERDGKDYYFMTKEEFLHRVAKHEFVEFEEAYSGAFYGTLQSELQRIWDSGRHVIFDVDVEGGLRLKHKYPEKALAVFVRPPSMRELEKRLANRGTDGPDKLKERLAKASREITYAGKFDHILLNDRLERACEEAEKLIGDFIYSQKR